MTAPTVSVILPVYNAERYIAEAIESVLGQSGATIDLIVVDDGSTDGSATIVTRYGGDLRLLSQENAGIGAARNTGVAEANGDYLAFLDADDLWSARALERRLACLLETANGPDIVVGQVQQFRGAPGEERRPDGPAQPGYFAGAMLLRAETFRRVGPFTTAWKVGEFIDWYTRAQDLGLTTAILPEVTLLRRLHDSNTARLSSGRQQEFVDVVRAALERRRRRRQ